MWRRCYSEQLRVFFSWLSEFVKEEDVILVESSKGKKYFSFTFPLRVGDLAKEIPVPREEATFLVRQPHTSEVIPDSSWVKIFLSPELEIFERRSRIRIALPLRWGLAVEEKKLAIRIAHDALTQYFFDAKNLANSYFSNLSPRLLSHATVGVALWVGGTLRGSQIVETESFAQGVASAAILASQDKRFEPILPSEREHIQVQVTLAHNLRMPLSAVELSANRIYPEKGYLLQNGRRKGWFLPEVFNVRRFLDLNQLIENLAREKAGLDPVVAKDSRIFIFEVDDFVESAEGDVPLALYGPMPRSHAAPFPREFFLSSLRLALHWLSALQKPDGDILAVINPLSGQEKPHDSTRLAFTAFAAAEFGRTTNDSVATTLAQRCWSYCSQNFSKAPPLSRIYGAWLALTLGKRVDALMLADALAKEIGDPGAFREDPILLSQLASLLGRLSHYDKDLLPIALKSAAIVKEEFELKNRRHEPISLALYAELMNSSLILASVTGATELSRFADEISEWLVAYQLPIGAFAATTASAFPYVRGTGKVVEVLALNSKRYGAVVDRALAWLISMQFDTQSSYFVRQELRPRIIGGFRHDYLNQEAWIDAAGHILLAGARLFAHQAE